jgi:hypothetical protein
VIVGALDLDVGLERGVDLDFGEPPEPDTDDPDLDLVPVDESSFV